MTRRATRRVRTVIVALGLAHGIALASALATAGAAVMLATLATLYWVRGVPLSWSVALLPAAAACLWLTNAIGRLSREVSAAPLGVGIARVKTAAKNVPA